MAATASSSVAAAKVQSSGSMEIFVKRINGKIITLDVESSDSIVSVKTKIQSTEHIPPDEQCLVFERKQMQDDHTLADHSAQNGSVLYLRQVNLFRVFVRTVTGKTVTINFDDGASYERASVASLKSMIEAKEGIPLNHQILIFRGKELDNNLTLIACFCDVYGGIVVHLVVRVSGPFSMAVRIYRGQNDTLDCALDVESSDSNAIVKSKIRDKAGVSCERQRIIYAGADLSDMKTLGAYRIDMYSTLQVALRHCWTIGVLLHASDDCERTGISVTSAPGAELLRALTPVRAASSMTSAAVTALALAVAPSLRPPRSDVHVGSVDVMSPAVRTELVGMIDSAWARGQLSGRDEAYIEANPSISGSCQTIW